MTSLEMGKVSPLILPLVHFFPKNLLSSHWFVATDLEMLIVAFIVQSCSAAVQDEKNKQTKHQKFIVLFFHQE